MKKVLSYILISVILLANFLAPVSVGWGSENRIEIQKNEVKAADEINFTIIPTPTSNSMTVKGEAPLGTMFGQGATLIVGLYDSTNTLVGTEQTSNIYNFNPSFKISYSVNFTGLKPATPYSIKLKAMELPEQTMSGVYTLNETGQVVVPTSAAKISAGEVVKNTNINTGKFSCSFLYIGDGTPMGCVAQGFYYILFIPTSYLFALAGTMFDYTFNYSVQDSSYRSAFVVQGWGLVRDFCNMFFIFIMLYVAIGTILSLHSMKTKETIINVVIIGLFINFSLFATQVIIDASNITARVFYNADAIKITEKGANGVAKLTPGLDIGPDGVIPLSAALVNKVNPQQLIMSADKVNSIQNKSVNELQNVSASQKKEEDKSLGIGQFILVIIMASAVNIVGFTVFLTVGFLFIARVVGLWMAMIMAPLAFFTYILPEMAGTKMIGWKNWWGDTLELAFLAPVFIFFMYIILKFLQIDLISDIASKSMMGDGLGYFVSLIVPFAFIMILMMKAKKIAVDMSGEFGEMAVKAGSAVGGMALGGAIGVGAFAMRGTIGKMGNALAESKFAKTNGRFGRMLGDAGKWTATSSFDVRNTKAGAAAGKYTGADIGKGQEGGYKKYKADTQKKREERAKSLEVGHDEHEMHDLHEKEEGLQALRNAKSTELTAIQGKIDSWGTDSREKDIRANQLEQRNENIRKSGGTVTQDQENEAVDARAKAISVAKNLQEAKDRKDEIRNDKSDGIMTSVSQKAVDVSNEDAVAAEDEAIVARTSANAARNTLNNIPVEEQAAITKAQNDATAISVKAQSDAQAAITKAQNDATAISVKAQSDAQAAITKAQNNAQKAEQAKLAAFTRKMENPYNKEASDAYEEAKNNDTIAKTNLVSITNNAPAEAQAAAAKAQADAQAIITDLQTKAQEATTKAQADAQAAITKAQADAQAATAKAQIALNTAETIATKKETSATSKRTRATELETAHRDKKKIARSMNDLEFQEIPEAKQVVSTISAGRKNKYADGIKGYWFNRSANEHAAHNIRMNAEIKSDGKVGGH